MKRHLVAFGLNYPGSMNSLNGCINDMKYWEGFATQKGVDEILTLSNHQCSKSAIVDALNSTLSKAQPGDEFFDAYSGHGTIVDPGIQSLVPDDFNWDNPNTWLTYDELDRIFMPHELRGVNIVAIHDSCHSSANPMVHFRAMNPHPPKNRYLEPPQYVKDRIVADPYDRNVITGPRGALLLAGCGKAQTSADFYCTDDNTYHGGFTYYTSVGLSRNSKMNYFDAVLNARALLAQNGFDQVPTCLGDDIFKLKAFFE